MFSEFKFLIFIEVFARILADLHFSLFGFYFQCHTSEILNVKQ